LPPRPLYWRQLVPGIGIIAVIGISAVAVLVFARVGALRGDTYRLYVMADEARGVIEGTEVWLAGQKVGVVDGVEFRPVTADTLGRLAVALDVLTSVQPAIRRDSRAEFRNGATPIGATIVAISTGSPRSPVLQPHDTLPRAPQIDPDSVRSALSAAASQMPGLLDDAQALIAGFRRALGPIPVRGAATLDSIADRTRTLTPPADSSTGTIAHINSDTAMHARAKRIAANISALRNAADSGGTLGRTRNEPALDDALVDVREKISTIRRQIEEERGTAGRLAHDHALVHQLRILEARLRPATTDRSEADTSDTTSH
jgi:phospholipid/cholesterol/gamma-HCH transport system substrate-binding protein